MATVHKEDCLYHRKFLVRLIPELITIFIVPLAVFLFNQEKSQASNWNWGLFFALSGFLSMVFLIPVIPYLRYIYYSHGIEVAVDRSTRTIEITYGAVKRGYSFSDITSITQVISPMTWSFWDTRLFHYEIVLVGGECIIVTSLMTDHIGLELVPTSTIRVPLAWIRRPTNSIVNGLLKRKVAAG